VDGIQYMLEQIENEAGVYSSGSGFTAGGQLTVEESEHCICRIESKARLCRAIVCFDSHSNSHPTTSCQPR